MSAVHETAVPEARARAFDVGAHPRRVPDPLAEVHGKPLVYLDNANTTQKPRAVIDAIAATTRKRTRTSTAALTSSPRRRPRPTRAPGRRSRASSARAAPKEIVFTRGTTEAINLVAAGFAPATS